MLKIIASEKENNNSIIRRFNRLSLFRKNIVRKQQYFIKPAKRKMWRS